MRANKRTKERMAPYSTRHSTLCALVCLSKSYGPQTNIYFFPCLNLLHWRQFASFWSCSPSVCSRLLNPTIRDAMRKRKRSAGSTASALVGGITNQGTTFWWKRKLERGSGSGRSGCKICRSRIPAHDKLPLQNESILVAPSHVLFLVLPGNCSSSFPFPDFSLKTTPITRKTNFRKESKQSEKRRRKFQAQMVEALLELVRSRPS